MIYRDTNIQAARAAGNFNTRRDSSGGRGGGRRGGGGSDPLAAAEASINSIANLVVNLDARDPAQGAITHWIDRVSAYDFAGTATANTAINSRPTITGNGSSNILTSSAAIAGISGASAITVVAAMLDTDTGTKIISELSALYTSNAGSFTTYVDLSGGRFSNAGFGNVGATVSTTLDTLGTAAVWTTQINFALASAEAGVIRKNGAAPATITQSTNSNNTGTFGSYALNLFARTGALFAWSGSISKYLLFSRALTAGEMLQAERAVGVITGITVA